MTRYILPTFLFIFAIGLTYAWAQHQTDDPNDINGHTQCKTYTQWMSKHIDDIDLSVLGDRPHRVLKPNSMATMDYNPNRLNIHTTEDGVIIQQDCG